MTRKLCRVQELHSFCTPHKRLCNVKGGQKAAIPWEGSSSVEINIFVKN